jgi:glycopeptide antibiotics resistance protein
MQRWLITGAVAFYLIALLLVVFWPTTVTSGVSTQFTEALRWLRIHRLGALNFWVIERTANVLLFVPLGILAAYFFRSGGRIIAIATCAAASMAIEFGQYVLLPHRFASWDDVVCNSLGGAIGVLIVVLAERRARTRLAFEAARPS